MYGMRIYERFVDVDGILAGWLMDRRMDDIQTSTQRDTQTYRVRVALKEILRALFSKCLLSIVIL